MKHNNKALIFDRILRRSTDFVDYMGVESSKSHKIPPGFLSLMGRAQVVECTNVFRYILECGKKWRWDDASQARPPFDVIWLEHSYHLQKSPSGKGILVYSQEASRAEIDELESGNIDWTESFPPDSRHIRIRIFIVEFSERDNLAILEGAGAFCLTLDGTPCSGMGWDGRLREDPELGAELERNIAWAALTVLLTFQFANCKNVTLKLNHPDEKFSRVQERKHGKPLTSYRTIEIDPAKEILRTEGGIEQNGLKKALHICRGHFATYTPEKGFLGRPLEEPVTVWKPAHVRGSKEHGEIVKDYRVKGK